MHFTNITNAFHLQPMQLHEMHKGKLMYGRSGIWYCEGWMVRGGRCKSAGKLTQINAETYIWGYGRMEGRLKNYIELHFNRNAIQLSPVTFYINKVLIWGTPFLHVFLTQTWSNYNTFLGLPSEYVPRIYSEYLFVKINWPYQFNYQT